MEQLPRDVWMIVYRYVHNYQYRIVRSQYHLKYVSKWNEHWCCYKDDRNDVIASWRTLQAYINYRNYSHCPFVYDMLGFPKKHVPSNRGGYKGFLPKNY